MRPAVTLLKKCLYHFSILKYFCILLSFVSIDNVVGTISLIYLKGQVLKRWRAREIISHIFNGLFPIWTQQPGVGQAEGRNLELHLGLP